MYSIFPRLIASVALPLILSGCLVTGPDYHKPDIVMPASWSSKADTRAPSIGSWWKKLNDPVLDQLIAYAVRNSPDVATAKARVRQARADFVSAGGALYPDLKASSNYKRFGGSAPLETASSQIGLSTRWELDLFGGNKRGVEAAYYKVEAANEQLRAALVVLIGDVASNYTNLRAAQAAIAIAQHNAASQRQTVALTRNQVQAGQSSPVDLLSAETQAATTEAKIPSLRINYAQNLNMLSVLTGASSATLVSLLDRARPIPAIPRNAAAGLPADLLASRPDIRAAERDYAGSTASIGQKEANLYPQVSLTGNIDTSGMHLGDLGRLSTISWGVGPSITLPIFQGGKLNAEIDAAKAARDQSFIAYRKTILNALSEVENASVSLNQNRLRVLQMQKIVSNSRKINELTREQYRVGMKSFADVLTAQRNLLDSEDSLNQTKTQLVLNYVALQKALGGGWNSEVNVLKPEVVDGYTGPRIIKTLPAPALKPQERS